MNAVKLVRVDYRLIHGQVITKWNNKVMATDIVIIDNELATDDFMLDVYMMAAPPGVEVKVCTVDQFIENEKAGEYEDGRILVLIKKVSTLSELMDNKIVFPEIQIGGLGGKKDNRQIVRGITISSEEEDVLKSLKEKGIKIYFQVTPEENKVNL